jgi:hypothetical protein
MTEQEPTAAQIEPEKRMFLYQQPELLSFEEHGRLAIDPSQRPFEFARNANAIPIAAVELASVQRHYPIVFSDIEKPTLLAMVGVSAGVNLFIDENGEWEKGTYLPGYLRCYPFALAPRPDDQFAVVVDRAAPSITEGGKQPLFEGKSLAKPIKDHVDFCAQFSSYRQATSVFCDKLADLGLLSGQQAKFTPDEGEEQSIGSYVAVDLAKLKDLDAGTLRELHLDGTLSGIYAHAFSLDNWIRLIEKRRYLRASNRSAVN